MVFTTLQEKTKKIFFIILSCFAALLLLEAGVLVGFYTKSVNARHEISQLRTQITATQSNNAQTKDRLFAVFDAASVDAFASEHGMVKEQNPTYLRVDSSWVLASY